MCEIIFVSFMKGDNMIQYINCELGKVTFTESYQYPYISFLHDRCTLNKSKIFQKRLSEENRSCRGILMINIPFCNYNCSFCKNEKISAFEDTAMYFTCMRNELEYYLNHKYVQGIKLDNIYILCGSLNNLKLDALYDLIQYILESFSCESEGNINISMSDAILSETRDFIKKIRPNCITLTIPSFDQEIRNLLNIDVPLDEVYDSLNFCKKEKIQVIANTFFGDDVSDRGVVENDITILDQYSVNYIHLQLLHKFQNCNIMNDNSFSQIKCLIEMKKSLEVYGYKEIYTNYFAKKPIDKSIVECILKTDNLSYDKIALGSTAYGKLNNTMYCNSSYKQYIQNDYPSYSSIKHLTDNEMSYMQIKSDLCNGFVIKEYLEQYINSKDDNNSIVNYLLGKGIISENEDRYKLEKMEYKDTVYFYLLPEIERSKLLSGEKVVLNF